MNLAAKCKLFNALQPMMEVELKRGNYVAVTYCSSLRLGSEGHDPFCSLRVQPDSVLIRPEFDGHQLQLKLFHGRVDKDEEMEDHGFAADSVDGHVHPSGDAIILKKDGIVVVTYTGDTYTEQLIQMDGDMVFFDGNYYGDWSVTNDAVLR